MVSSEQTQRWGLFPHGLQRYHPLPAAEGKPGTSRGFPIPGFVKFQRFFGCWWFPNSCHKEELGGFVLLPFKEHLNFLLPPGILAPGGVRALFPNDIFRTTSILALKDSWKQSGFSELFRA